MARKKGTTRGQTQRDDARAVDGETSMTTICPIDWKREISDSLAWAHQRSWAIAGIALCLSVVCIYQYATYWHVSLSITSSALITALPSLLALVAYAATVLALSAMLPAAVLLTPLQKGGPVLYEVFVRAEGEQGVAFRVGPALCWIGGLIAAAVLLLTLFLILPEALLPYSVGVAILIGIAFFLVVLVMLQYILKGGGRNVRWKDASADFMLMVALATFVQLVWVLTCLQIVTKLAPEGNQVMQVGWALGHAVIAIAVIGVCQLGGAKLFVDLKGRRNPVRRTALVATTALAFLICLPPVGAGLAAIAFQVPASGGRACLVLNWASSAGEEVNGLRDEHNGSISKPLRLLLDADGIYQVRIRGVAEQVRFVAHAQVAGMEACPEPGDGPEAKAAAAEVTRAHH